MKIVNTTRQVTLCENCIIADTFFTRFKGLMGKKELKPGNGLMIVPCNSIHMFFMKFSIDVVFVDKNNNIVHIIENIKPWRTSRVIWKSHSVIELPAGTIPKTGTQVNDRIKMYKASSRK